MQSLTGGSLQSSIPCHHRSCRSQTVGRAQQHRLNPGYQLDQQLKGRSQPFVPAKLAKGMSLREVVQGKISQSLNIP